MLIQADHLMLLVNQLGDAVTVEAPLLGLTLLRVDLSDRRAVLLDLVSGGEYRRAVDAVRQRLRTATEDICGDNTALAGQVLSAARAEVPNHDRIRDALRQAGVLQPENLDEIRDLQAQAHRSNPAQGGDIFYFACDNNALRNRLYSQFLQARTPRDPHLNFVLAGQIRNEFDLREGKIHRELLSVLNAGFTGLNVKDVLNNQNRLRDRLRLLGLSEWNKLRASRSAEETKTGDETPGAPLESDAIIIRTYARFADQPGRKVILFSSDNEFVVQASGRTNLLARAVRYASHVPDPLSASWESVARLFYQLAVIYGRLDLHRQDGSEIRLYGVWQKKGDADWEHERLRVAMAADESVRGIRTAIDRNLAILSDAETS